MYETILVPTDGSDIANTAVDHALDLADRYDATVHALYVIDLDAVDLGLGSEQVDRLRQGRLEEMPELENRARSATETVAERATERGIEVVEAVAGGRPHRKITSYADDHDVDLIVMGSAGRSGVRRALLGSVAERTLRSTKRPVLVVDIRTD